MSLSIKTRRRILERDDYTCWRCGAVEDPEEATWGAPGLPAYLFRFQVDHLLPRNHGGTDDDWNLAAACRSCNLGRQDAIEQDALDLAAYQKLEWFGFRP